MILLVNAIMVGVFFAKVACFIFLMFWIRATLPRMRVDRLMNFAWKYLVPLSIVNILVAAVWYELVAAGPEDLHAGRHCRSTALVGWLVTGPDRRAVWSGS